MVTTVSEYKSAAVSDRGLNESRPQNEDSYLELPQHGLFAVADGVGGAQAGEVASQMAVEILGEAFANMGPNADPEDTMRIALERANEAIHQMSRDIPQLSSMATTIVAVHISGDMATIGHVGDSRVYRLGGDGRLFRETDDHSLVEEEVRAGRMTPEQALSHPSRNVISRALGADETVVPDIKCVLVHPGTTFLLCSDGITRHLDDSEIEQLLNSEFGPEDVCARMKDICFSRGAEDNLTAVVVRFAGDRRLAPISPEDDDDIEETTIAGVRAPEPGSAGVDTGELVDTRAFQEQNEVSPVLVEPIEDSAEVGAEVDAGLQPDRLAADDSQLSEGSLTSGRPIAPAVTPSSPKPYTAYDAALEPQKSSGPGRLLSLIAVFILGSALGTAAGYYLLAPVEQTTVVVPPEPAPQSENIQLSSFESTRRIVDGDPVKYLNANAVTPQTADDFFWLGRALLLTGKPVEAKRQFEEARNRLSTFDDRSSARTMANEIAMALALINSPQASETFKKESEALNSANTANVNSNTAGNGSRLAP